jgi:hypothetical protein
MIATSAMSAISIVRGFMGRDSPGVTFFSAMVSPFLGEIGGTTFWGRI